MMSDDMFCQQLLEISRTRSHLRRHLFKELRQIIPKYNGPERFMLRRKAELNFLGDFTDKYLVTIIRKIKAEDDNDKNKDRFCD